MNSIYDIVKNSPLITDNDKYYWGYQYKLAEEVLVPFLAENSAFKPNFSVCEIGCAEGGVLSAFVEAGANAPLGTDISQVRLDIGKQISKISKTKINFVFHNILENEIDDEWTEAFDLVLLRDVIEHLDDTLLCLNNIKKILKPGGSLFVTFPPYYSLYGGHQHTVANLLGKLPYIHLLPKSVFHWFVKSGRQNDIGEVMRLRNIALTPKKFINAAKLSDMKIISEKYYLLRPVFKMKFGLPTINISPLAMLPCVKNVFSMEAAFVLKKQ